MWCIGPFSPWLLLRLRSTIRAKLLQRPTLLPSLLFSPLCSSPFSSLLPPSAIQKPPSFKLHRATLFFITLYKMLQFYYTVCWTTYCLSKLVSVSYTQIFLFLWFHLIATDCIACQISDVGLTLVTVAMCSMSIFIGESVFGSGEGDTLWLTLHCKDKCRKGLHYSFLMVGTPFFLPWTLDVADCKHF